MVTIVVLFAGGGDHQPRRIDVKWVAGKYQGERCRRTCPMEDQHPDGRIGEH